MTTTTTTKEAALATRYTDDMLVRVTAQLTAAKRLGAAQTRLLGALTAEQAKRGL